MPKLPRPASHFTPKAVVDTNLFVRGLLKGPVTLPLIQAWKAKRFQLVTSESMLAELFEVLARPKFARYFTQDDARELGDLIYERAEVVEPIVHVALCRDPKDDIFLDAAIAGQAQYLVTGDDDLRSDETLIATMEQTYGIKVVNVPDFLKQLKSK